MLEPESFPKVPFFYRARYCGWINRQYTTTQDYRCRVIWLGNVCEKPNQSTVLYGSSYITGLLFKRLCYPTVEANRGL